MEFKIIKSYALSSFKSHAIKFHLKAPMQNTDTSVKLEIEIPKEKKQHQKEIKSSEFIGHKLGEKGLHCQQLNFPLLVRNGNLCIMQYGNFPFFSDFGHRKRLH